MARKNEFLNAKKSPGFEHYNLYARCPTDLFSTQLNSRDRDGGITYPYRRDNIAYYTGDTYSSEPSDESSPIPPILIDKNKCLPSHLGPFKESPRLSLAPVKPKLPSIPSASYDPFRKVPPLPDITETCNSPRKSTDDNSQEDPTKVVIKIPDVNDKVDSNISLMSSGCQSSITSVCSTQPSQQNSAPLRTSVSKPNVEQDDIQLIDTCSDISVMSDRPDSCNTRINQLKALRDISIGAQSESIVVQMLTEVQNNISDDETHSGFSTPRSSCSTVCLPGSYEDLYLVVPTNGDDSDTSIELSSQPSKVEIKTIKSSQHSGIKAQNAPPQDNRSGSAPVSIGKIHDSSVPEIQRSLGKKELLKGPSSRMCCQTTAWEVPTGDKVVLRVSKEATQLETIVASVSEGDITGKEVHPSTVKTTCDRIQQAKHSAESVVKGNHKSVAESKKAKNPLESKSERSTAYREQKNTHQGSLSPKKNKGPNENEEKSTPSDGKATDHISKTFAEADEHVEQLPDIEIDSKPHQVLNRVQGKSMYDFYAKAVVQDKVEPEMHRQEDNVQTTKKNYASPQRMLNRPQQIIHVRAVSSDEYEISGEEMHERPSCIPKRHKRRHKSEKGRVSEHPSTKSLISKHSTQSLVITDSTEHSTSTDDGEHLTMKTKPKKSYKAKKSRKSSKKVSPQKESSAGSSKQSKLTMNGTTTGEAVETNNKQNTLHEEANPDAREMQQQSQQDELSANEKRDFVQLQTENIDDPLHESNDKNLEVQKQDTHDDEVNDADDEEVPDLRIDLSWTITERGRCHSPSTSQMSSSKSYDRQNPKHDVASQTSRDKFLIVSSTSSQDPGRREKPKTIRGKLANAFKWKHGNSSGKKLQRSKKVHAKGVRKKQRLRRFQMLKLCSRPDTNSIEDLSELSGDPLQAVSETASQAFIREETVAEQPQESISVVEVTTRLTRYQRWKSSVRNRRKTAWRGVQSWCESVRKHFARHREIANMDDSRDESIEYQIDTTEVYADATEEYERIAIESQERLEILSLSAQVDPKAECDVSTDDLHREQNDQDSARSLNSDDDEGIVVAESSSSQSRSSNKCESTSDEDVIEISYSNAQGLCTIAKSETNQKHTLNGTKKVSSKYLISPRIHQLQTENPLKKSSTDPEQERLLVHDKTVISRQPTRSEEVLSGVEQQRVEVPSAEPFPKDRDKFLNANNANYSVHEGNEENINDNAGRQGAYVPKPQELLPKEGDKVRFPMKLCHGKPCDPSYGSSDTTETLDECDGVYRNPSYFRKAADLLYGGKKAREKVEEWMAPSTVQRHKIQTPKNLDDVVITIADDSNEEENEDGKKTEVSPRLFVPQKKKKPPIYPSPLAHFDAFFHGISDRLLDNPSDSKLYKRGHSEHKVKFRKNRKISIKDDIKFLKDVKEAQAQTARTPTNDRFTATDGCEISLNDIFSITSKKYPRRLAPVGMPAAENTPRRFTPVQYSPRRQTPWQQSTWRQTPGQHTPGRLTSGRLTSGRLTSGRLTSSRRSTGPQTPVSHTSGRKTPACRTCGGHTPVSPRAQGGSTSGHQTPMKNPPLCKTWTNKPVSASARLLEEESVCKPMSFVEKYCSYHPTQSSIHNNPLPKDVDWLYNKVRAMEREKERLRQEQEELERVIKSQEKKRQRLFKSKAKRQAL